MRRAVDNPLDGAAVDELMQRALEATAGTYPHPNPRVGAVIISPNGSVRSVGAHVRPGTPHAERIALDGLEGTEGDTMVVTLEPCNHHGRTPPCTEAIIEAGIATVVVGALDPDPLVSGAGVAALRSAGVEVIDSGLAATVEANDPAYFHHRRSGRPLVTLKLATTLDGQVAAADGTSQWITSDEARRDAHHLRSRHDAVLVGAGTVRADDPELTVRVDGWDGPQPVPVILKGGTDLPADARIFARDPIILEPAEGSIVDIGDALDALARRGVLSVLVEGGAGIARSFLDAGCVDEIVMYIGGRIAGGVGLPAIAGEFSTITEAHDVTYTDVSRIGPDLKITAQLERNI